MEYYSALKKKEILLYATTRLNVEGIMLTEISQSLKDNHCMIPIWVVSLKLRHHHHLPPQTQVEDGDHMLTTSTKNPDWLKTKGWWLRFLKHHPVTSPPTNQKKVMFPEPLTPNLSFKTLPWKPLRSLGLLSMSCPFSLLGPMLGALQINAGLSFTTSLSQYMALLHVGEWTQVWFRNTTHHIVDVKR